MSCGQSLETKRVSRFKVSKLGLRRKVKELKIYRIRMEPAERRSQRKSAKSMTAIPDLGIVPTFELEGSFGCEAARFAHVHFAQDDKTFALLKIAGHGTIHGETSTTEITGENRENRYEHRLTSANTDFLTQLRDEAFAWLSSGIKKPSITLQHL